MATRISGGEKVRRSIEFQFGVDPGPLKDGVKIAENSIAGLEQELENLKSKFETEEIGTENFEKLGRQIQEVESKLKAIDTRFEALTGEQKAAALVDSFNGVAGAIGAVTGAMVALGIESDALDEVEKRLLGLVNVVVGLQAVSKSLESIGKIAPGVAAAITRVGLAIRAAIVANPILAAVAAFTALAAAIILTRDNSKKLEEQLEREKKAREANLRSIQANTEYFNALYDALAFQYELEGKLIEAQETRIKGAETALTQAELAQAAEEKGAQALIKAKKEEIKALEQTYKNRANLLSLVLSPPYSSIAAREKELASLEIEKLERLKPLQAELKALNDEYYILGNNVLRAAQALDTERAKLDAIKKEQAEAAKQKRDERVKKQVDELIKQNLAYDEFIVKLKAIRGITQTEIVEATNRAAEAWNEAAAELQAWIDNQVKYLDNTQTLVQTGLRAIKLTEEEVQGLVDLWDEANDNLEKYTFLSQEQLDVLKRLRGDAGQSELQQLLANLQVTYESELKLFADNEEVKTQLTEEYERNREKIRRQYAAETARNILASTSQLFNVLAEINQQNLELQLLQAGNNATAIEAINRKAFEDQKKLRVGQAAVTTAESILNGYNATSTLPPPFNFIAGTALAVAYGALGAKTIQTILATKYGSTTTTQTQQRPRFGGINLTGGGTANVPSGIPTGILPGIGGGRERTPTVGTIAEGPIRAYVLAGDVSTGLGANIALNNRRRLGG